MFKAYMNLAGLMFIAGVTYVAGLYGGFRAVDAIEKKWPSELSKVAAGAKLRSVN